MSTTEPTDRERDHALFQDRPSNAGMYPQVTVSAELYEVLCRVYVEARVHPSAPTATEPTDEQRYDLTDDEATTEHLAAWWRKEMALTGELYHGQISVGMAARGLWNMARASSAPPSAPTEDVAKLIEEAEGFSRYSRSIDQGEPADPAPEIIDRLIAALRSGAAVPVEDNPDYREIFGRNPEVWRTPFGALRLTLMDDEVKPHHEDRRIARARVELDALGKVLNEQIVNP